MSLVGLVFQNTGLIIALKISLQPEAAPYATSSVVLVSESLKLLLCSLVVMSTRSDMKFVAILTSIRRESLLFLPSFLYVLQNNFLLYGAAQIPPLVFIVCTQTKVLTTAALSRIILGTRLSMTQHISLFFLTAGVVLVQQTTRDGKSEGKSHFSNAFASNGTLGICAVLLASVSSGLAGVVLEKIYKEVSTGSDVIIHDVWTRNVQLSVISLPFAMSGILIRDMDSFFKERGIFRGYNSVVWCIIGLQASGGIFIAFVMKYTDNIVKCLALSVSVCLCAVYSFASNDVDWSPQLMAGVLIVVSSVSAYSFGESKTSVPLSQKA